MDNIPYNIVMAVPLPLHPALKLLHRLSLARPIRPIRQRGPIQLRASQFGNGDNLAKGRDGGRGSQINKYWCVQSVPVLIPLICFL